MSRETYLSPPQPVEVFAAKDGGTDIILRQNIEEIVKPIEAQRDEDGNVIAEESWATVYECEERQMHHKGSVEAWQISENFTFWWELAGGSTDVEAADAAAEAAGEPTILERLEALEDAILELAEVI